MPKLSRQWLCPYFCLGEGTATRGVFLLTPVSMPSTGPAELPDWLKDLRTKVSSSPQFKTLSNQLYNEIRDAVRDQGLASFSDLSDEEQRVVVARARETLRETDEFAVARDAAWTTVDVALDAAAESWLSERQAFGCAAPTKVDALAELAGSGATQLLARWPEQSHRQLLWLLNADLRRRSAVHSGGSS